MKKQKTNEIALIIESSGVEKSTGELLTKSFFQFFEDAKQWKQKAEALVVTDRLQTKEMKEAREARLVLKKLRVSADDKRKELKAESIKYNKAVQSVYSEIEAIIKPIESHLLKQEKFAEREDAKRLKELSEAREMEVSLYADVIPLGINYGAMSEADFNKLIDGAKAQIEAERQRIEKERIEREEIEKAIKKSEEEQAKKDAKQKEEAEKLKQENARLKKEAERVEAKAKAKAEKLEKARLEKAKEVQAEVNKKIEEERQKRAEAEAKFEEEKKRRETEVQKREEQAKNEAEAERKRNAAPDKDKLKMFAQQLKNIKYPELQDRKAAFILSNAKKLILKTSLYIIQNVEKV